ncbi:MAG: type II toxin-antitoxin system RelE/ParE family toxin [Candidatus Hydrogenedens sp.]|nr:type II toxin-antitoxin system RelE/ParE family toxin [Candidatus Hydrogenedens sp.]
MRYRIEWKSSALREFRKLPANVRDSVRCRIEGLADEPRPSGCKKLSGIQGVFRVRDGDYRILYEIEDEAIVIVILRVRHRGESYRGL